VHFSIAGNEDGWLLCSEMFGVKGLTGQIERACCVYQVFTKSKADDTRDFCCATKVARVSYLVAES